MRLRIEFENERSVMDSICLARWLYNRQYFRFNEILGLSALKKPTLQRVLRRLIKRAWIKKEKAWSSTGLGPDIGGIFHLMSSEEANSEKLPKEARGLVLFPREIVEEFNERSGRLNRKKIGGFNKIYLDSPKRVIIKDGYMIVKDPSTDVGAVLGDKYVEIIPEYDNESYNAILNDPKQTHPKKRLKILREGGMRFTGRAKLWREIKANTVGKEYTFYQMIEYPFIVKHFTPSITKPPFITKPTSKDRDRFSLDYDAPLGTRRLWKNAAKELLYIHNIISQRRINIKKTNKNKLYEISMFCKSALDFEKEFNKPLYSNPKHKECFDENTGKPLPWCACECHKKPKHKRT